jgi:hypothetical protein
MAAPAVLRQLSEATDKRKEIFKALGSLAGISVQRNLVLVAVYIGDKYIPGTKLLRSDQNLKEDVWQATAGLIVKMGPTAFTLSDNKTHDIDAPVVGDWVTFVPGEGRRIQINGVDLRIFVDDNITMTISDPSTITARQ